MNLLRRIEDTAASSLFIIGVIISLYGVGARYIFGTAQSWTNEAYSTFLLWAIFIGFGTALRDNHHVSIDYLYDKMNEKWKRVFDLIVVVIGIGFSIFFLISGLQMVITTFNQELITQDLGIPVWITYLVLPLGGLMLFIHFIVKGNSLFPKLTR